MAEQSKLISEKNSGDVFENAIRRFGIVAACEWFGHSPDSDFTKDTFRVLEERVANENLKEINE